MKVTLTASGTTLPRRLSRQQAKNETRRLAEAGHVSFTRHVLERGVERNISTSQMLACLIKGDVVTDPWLSDKGHFRFDMARHRRGEELTLAVALDVERDVVVITAY
ncbi:DUF4258 domain-containing protein [Microvirga tunisiensis]|uniref:DUF4258 domain-containing protein n=1 Tax=Pannonibacter tanglangensis TaxID=2750084 RepID=A0A7X5J6K1_9HYPH|nr:DUF4258 domain-containing protein [Pannonibacter sp. XCT-53]